MKKIGSTIAHLATAGTIAWGAVSTATPAFAQTGMDFPALSFPTKDGQWGCRFTRTCTTATNVRLESMPQS